VFRRTVVGGSSGSGMGALGGREPRACGSTYGSATPPEL